MTPWRHARPNVSVTTTPRRRRCAGRSRREDASPIDRGRSGSSTAVPSSVLERSTPALALTKPWRVSVMRSVPRRRRTRRGLGLDERDLVLVGPVEGDDSTLGLGDDLARDDDEVVVRRALSPASSSASSTGPRGRRRVATLAARREGDEAQLAHDSTASASRRAFAGSAMIVVVTTTRGAALADRVGERRVGLVDDPRADESLVEVDHAERRRARGPARAGAGRRGPSAPHRR